MKYHYTYELINTVNDMRYIGCRSSICIPTLDTKYMSSSKYVRAAIEEFGVINFKKKILNIFTTRAEAVSHEVTLHIQYDVDFNENFYNRSKQKTMGFDTSSLTGDKNHFFEKHHSEETKAKLSAANKGKPSAFKGRTHTAETKAIIKYKRQFQGCTDATKAKMSIARSGRKPMLGKKHSEKSRKQTSDALVGRVVSEETRAKMCLANAGENHPMYGKTHAAESKAKTSESLRNIVRPNFYITPYGNYSSITAASENCTHSRKTILKKCQLGLDGWSIAANPDFNLNYSYIRVSRWFVYSYSNYRCLRKNNYGIY